MNIRKYYKTIFFALLIVFSVLATIPFLLQIANAKISEIKISTTKGEIGAFVVEPYGEYDSNYVFIVIHGFSASRVFMKPLAIEIARMGFKSVVIDQLGHYTAENPLELNWETKDVNSAASQGLAKTAPMIPEVIKVAREVVHNDSAKVIIVGHSLGGALSIIWGYFSKDVEMVFAIAPLPPYEFVNSTNPKKLVVILGEWDQVFNFDQEKELLRRAGWEDPQIDSEYRNGEILRALYRIKFSDHITECFTSFVVEKIAYYMSELTGREIHVGLVFSPIMFLIGVIIAPLVGIGILILFPFIVNSIFGFRPRENLDEIFKGKPVKQSFKRSLIFALIYSGLVYLIMSSTWGSVLTPTLPMTLMRVLLFAIMIPVLIAYLSIHEFLFKRFLPKYLSNKIQRPFLTMTLLSLVVRYVFLVSLVFGLYVLGAVLNMTSLSILIGVALLAVTLLPLIVILMELVATETYILTERLSATVAVNILPWAFIASAFVPIMTFPTSLL